LTSVPITALAAWLEQRRCAALVVASFVLSALIPLLGRTRLGDLSDHFGDHMHHAWATDILVHRGLDIYRRPFGDLWPGSTYPQKEEAWGQMARPYPPGVFAVFAPTTLVARTIPMGKPAFGALSIVWLLILTHVGFLAVFRLLDRASPGSRLIVGGIMWAVLLHLALQGFYDPVWICCGAALVGALRDDRPDTALRWFAVAALLSFRAVTLAPLGLWALWRAIGDKQPRAWPWRSLALAGAATLVTIACFVLVCPGTAARRAGAPSVLALAEKGEFVAVLVITAVAAIASIRLRDPVMAATMAIVGALALIDLGVYRGYWHHASIATVALLASLAREDDRSGVRRQLAVLLLVAIVPTVWLINPAALFIDMAAHFRPHR
jgi:uncharacterized membrane protein YiaA